jgi:tumor protein p53-inducible protein 3
MAAILRKRISFIGTTLKTRSNHYKSDLIENFSEEVLPYFNTGKLKLKIDSVSGMD